VVALVNQDFLALVHQILVALELVEHHHHSAHIKQQQEEVCLRLELLLVLI
jgi:hypothetical protein